MPEWFYVDVFVGGRKLHIGKVEVPRKELEEYLKNTYRNYRLHGQEVLILSPPKRQRSN